MLNRPEIARVVAGASNPIRKKSKEMHRCPIPLTTSENMAALMAAADLPRCRGAPQNVYLELPTIAIAVAENQGNVGSPLRIGESEVWEKMLLMFLG